MIYGRFTEAEMQARLRDHGPAYPFLVHGGKPYRITDMVRTLVGTWNYQAEEADEREVEAWNQEARSLAEPPEKEGPAPVRLEAEPPHPGPYRPAEVVVEQEPEDGRIPEGHELWVNLATYARVNGWPNKGRISNAIKREYAKQYAPKRELERLLRGEKDTPSQG